MICTVHRGREFVPVDSIIVFLVKEKQNMKKIITLVLALMMLMLAACGGNADQTTVADNAVHTA